MEGLLLGSSCSRKLKSEMFFFPELAHALYVKYRHFHENRFINNKINNFQSGICFMVPEASADNTGPKQGSTYYRQI
jgi:hypothetical protein